MYSTSIAQRPLSNLTAAPLGVTLSGSGTAVYPPRLSIAGGPIGGNPSGGPAGGNPSGR